MCGRKSKDFSMASGRLCKALLVCSLLAFFAVMPLAAWWGAPEKIQEPMVAAAPQQTQPSTNCSNGTKTELMDLSQVLSQLQTGKKVTAEIYDQAVALKTELEAYFKAVRSKFFANVGALYSFKGKLGVATNVGMRIGDGMMVSTGVQYMIGTLGDVAKIISDFNAEDLTASVTVGWEW